ncbi:MAG: hypothetical protein KDH15_15900 [Rhodocyclaceae bacterium]|nr:hypothetical protein [Rhodocyclaceae bacterium]
MPTIAGSIADITGVTFSITLVTLSLASGRSGSRSAPFSRPSCAAWWP